MINVENQSLLTVPPSFLSKLCMLGAPRLRPNPGLWELWWGHLLADVHRGGPVGREEDQQCSHCKSRPRLHVQVVLQTYLVSPAERGRGSVAAVQWARGGAADQTCLVERLWASWLWSQTKAASTEVRGCISLSIHPSIDGHLGYFHILAVVNNAAVNMRYIYFLN